jgi:hypothetical protein
LFVYYYERRTERQLSTTDGALFRHSATRNSHPQTPACEPEQGGPEVTESAE